MNIIWANRLIAGTKTWAEMPASRRAGVKKVLAERINKGEITADDYKRHHGRRLCSIKAGPICARSLLTRLETQWCGHEHAERGRICRAHGGLSAGRAAAKLASEP